MCTIGLLLTATLLAGCSPLHQPPTSADTQFSVVVYNRTQVSVFALFHEVPACGSTACPRKRSCPRG
jgi:hypothetical protein